MNSIDIVKIVFKNLLRRKTRTMLTVMGVVIGTASIVIMISIGIGMNEGFKNEISRMGSLNTINVRSPETGMYYAYNEAEAGRSNTTEMRDLDDAAAADFGRISGVESVIPFMETHGKIKIGKYIGYVQLQGINPEHMNKLGLKVSEGRLLDAGDKANVVFGFGVKDNLYNPKATQRRRWGGNSPNIDLLNERITLSLDMSYGEDYIRDESGAQKKPKTYKINGVGMLEEGNYEYYSSVFMDIFELKKIIKDFNKGKNKNDNTGDYRDIKDYSRIIVKVKDINNVQNIQNQIKDMGFLQTVLLTYLNQCKKLHPV